MSVENTLTVAEIDAQIKELMKQRRKAQPKKERAPRAPRTPKPVLSRHTRKVVCSNCGQADRKANMQRVSKFEYQHIMCAKSERTVIVRFGFNE